MVVFLIYILFCVVLTLATKNNIKNSKSFTLIMACIGLFFILGFRDISVGNDTERYVADFLSYQHRSLSDTFSQGSNYGFYVYNLLLSCIAPNGSQFYLIVTSFFIVFSLYCFLKRYTEDVLLSITMLLSLSFIYFFATGFKQSLAISVLLFSYEYIRENKFFKFLFVVLLASTFHTTALIFILAWPFSKLKLKKGLILLSTVLVLLAYIYSSQIFSFIKTIMGDDYFSSYGTSYKSQLNFTGLAIQICIFAFSLVCFWNQFDTDADISKLLSIYMVGMCFQAMTQQMAEFFRVSMYFNVFGVIMLPKAISYLKPRDKLVANLALLIIFILYFALFSGNASNFQNYKLFL